ncbi:uncharacterized protein LOC110177514 [Drosophila serrata]|uniref:uncharacterized protein LOC110177514 n=1 Tax=Drosophila serrata TaxID=7274 RepID=UPI000A1D0244|nr:uncharacterized protein LOC110177514 [Drosophila serrata]KAH8384370.1 hypothetical protein KR200_010427 [Drosophila serrata]
MLKLICAVAIIAMTLLESVQAQRPSFAGVRPPGGLNQKDKYHATQNTAVENITGVDIATRFGEPSSSQQPALVNLPFGAAQRPPMGVPLVLPTSGFESNPSQAAPSATPDVANRFGAPESSSIVPSAIPATSPTFTANIPAASSPSVPVSTTGSPQIPSRLPVDAHGDQEWVNHLSSLPVENQPFWFVNYQAIEAHRNSSRPNVGALETRGSFFRG